MRENIQRILGKFYSSYFYLIGQRGEGNIGKGQDYFICFRSYNIKIILQGYKERLVIIVKGKEIIGIGKDRKFRIVELQVCGYSSVNRDLRSLDVSMSYDMYYGFI